MSLRCPNIFPDLVSNHMRDQCYNHVFTEGKHYTTSKHQNRLPQLQFYKSQASCLEAEEMLQWNHQQRLNCCLFPNYPLIEALKKPI